jgi:hypothetical protein
MTTVASPIAPAVDADEPATLYTWVWSVQGWQVHALAEPRSDAWGMDASRCGAWHLFGCPVTVARRDAVCPRCAAGGVELLELLPSAAPGHL